MICLDMDGVLLNYGNHTTELRINHEFIKHLSENGVKEVSICTNQGGMVFSGSNPQKYPTPQRFVERAQAAIRALTEHGISVEGVHVAFFHPKAKVSELLKIHETLCGVVPQGFILWDAEEYRKPNPGMLKAARCTVFCGDSDEDGLAALAAGCEFVRVERFV